MTDVLAKRRARWAISGIFFANGTVIGSWAAHIPLVEERLGIGHAALGGRCSAWRSAGSLPCRWVEPPSPASAARQ